MTVSVPRPVPGAGAGAFAPVPITLSPKQAKSYFEFFSKGTTRHVILLGELAEQRVHFIRSLNYKVLCTSSTGACDLCTKAATSDDVSTAHPEFYAPAVVRKGERGSFEQAVAVFTDAMEKALREQLAEGPHRGHRFEVRRETNQKYKITVDRRGAHVWAAALPGAFDILPWIRARFGLPQDPGRPLVLVPSFSIRDAAAGPAARPRALELSTSDRRTAEEWARTKAAIAEAKERHAGGTNPAAASAEELPLAAEAEEPTTDGASVPVLVTGADVPVPEGTPAPGPGKIILVPVPAPAPSFADMRKRRDRAAAEGRTDNALSLGDEYAHLVPLNGKHDKKGGAK